MSIASDPALRAAPRPSAPPLAADVGTTPVVHETQSLPTLRPARRRAAYTALGVATVVLGLRLLATLLSTPLDGVANVAAPAWMIEVTTTSTKPTTALLYGREVGVQLVQVPAGQGAAAEVRIVPARLAKGEVHLVSLGLTSLHLHATAPTQTQPMTFDATAQILTVFQRPRMTGVRVGW